MTLSFSRRRLTGLRWLLAVIGLVLLGLSVRFLLHARYPVGADELYPLLYLQGFCLAIVAIVRSDAVRRILDRPPPAT